MAELEIRQFDGYDTQELGKPWVALMEQNGRYNFDKVISEYTGSLEEGTSGSLIVKNAVEGATYATGQKNRVTKESDIEYYKCTGNAFEQVTKETVREKVDRNLAAVSQDKMELTKQNVKEQIAGYQKVNNIVTLAAIYAYDTNKKGKPWVTEYTKEGIQFDEYGSLDAKPVGRVVGKPGEYMEAISINPKPEQVFVVGQKDLETGKTKMKFFEVDENNKVKVLSRQQVNEKLDIRFQPFQVEDAGKVVMNLPGGYDSEKYSMWVAKETKENGQASMVSKDANGELIGSYSGGREGAPGQFYVRQPEENAVYAVFKRDMETNKTEMVAKVQHVNGNMLEQPLRSAENTAGKAIIKSFEAFDHERYENPYVAKVNGEGKFTYSHGKTEGGQTLFVGGYTGRGGQGEPGDAYAWSPKEGDVFAVCQPDNQMLRTHIEFFEYSKGNFLSVDRETAIERAKEQDSRRQGEQKVTTKEEDQKTLQKMKEQVAQGKPLSDGQVTHLETYKQKYAAQKSAHKMVAEGKNNVVLAEIGAYDSAKLKSPYITKRGANGKFSFVSDSAVAEFVGGAEGGKLIVHNVKDGDVFTYGQARTDGEKQPANYAVIENGKAVSMEREEYVKWKEENLGKKPSPERAEPITVAEATKALADRGLAGAELQKALLEKGNIKEFEGKSAAQKNQIAGKAAKAVESKSKSMGRD